MIADLETAPSVRVHGEAVLGGVFTPWIVYLLPDYVLTSGGVFFLWNILRSYICRCDE